VPTALGVYETLQVAAVVPLAVRLGQGLGVNEPDPLVENMTVPVGFVAPLIAVSVTVAVHEDVVPTATGEEHDTTVAVTSLMPGEVTVAP